MNTSLVLGNVLFLRIYMIVVQIIYPEYIIFCAAPIKASTYLLCCYSSFGEGCEASYKYKEESKKKT